MTELRDIQKRALTKIHKRGITALNLPTGSGKSILAYEGSRNSSAVVATPTRALQQQYRHDPNIDCYVLMGRSSTHCQELGGRPPANDQWCTAPLREQNSFNSNRNRIRANVLRQIKARELDPNQIIHQCGEPHCYATTHESSDGKLSSCVIDYFRAEAQEHHFVVVNTALLYYYGLNPILSPILYERDRCWIDEAHIAVRVVAQAAEIILGARAREHLSQQIVDLGCAIDAAEPTGRDVWKASMSEAERLAVMPSAENLQAQANKIRQTIKNNESDDEPGWLRKLLSADMSDYCWHRQGPRIVGSLPNVEGLLSTKIMSAFPSAVAMSGTLAYPGDCGMDVDQKVIFDTPGWKRPKFNIKPLRCGTKAEFDVKQKERFDRIDACIERHADQRALVLFASAHEASQYFEERPSQRHTLQNSPACSVELSQHREQTDSVLLAYGGWEGLDLPDDDCRAVVIAKWPHVPPSPLRRARDSEMSRQGSTNVSLRETAMKVRQGMGRGLRHGEDACKVYVVDEPNKVIETLIKDSRLW